MSNDGGIDFVASWALRLRGRLFTQFASDPGFQALSDLIAAQFQDLENALQQLSTIFDIGDGVRTDVTGAVIGIGAQLDRIGRLVGQPRAGAVDDLYRYYLRARIQANRSSGDGESLYRVFAALLPSIGGVSATFTMARVGTAALLLQILGYPITPALASIARGFLADSKLAGVRAWLVYSPSPAARTFCFAGGKGKGFGSITSPTVGGGLAGAVVTP